MDSSIHLEDITLRKCSTCYGDENERKSVMLQKIQKLHRASERCEVSLVQITSELEADDTSLLLSLFTACSTLTVAGCDLGGRLTERMCFWMPDFEERPSILLLPGKKCLECRTIDAL
ncbi:hypothetical protein Leryth_013812 [Lithospermum erythrorhizon]|nr:hypothetical protein Leryth_013812 [Lithospermum erythrorhizon]